MDAERRGLVGDVAQAEADGDAVEAWRRRKGSRSALACTHATLPTQPASIEPVAAAREHGGVDVGEHDEAALPTWRASPAARSPVPPATSSARCPGRRFASDSVKRFHSRCVPADIRSFIRS